MQQQVQVLEPIDILKALYNSYLEKKIVNELNVDFYKWKSAHLSNGEDLGKVQENLQNSEHNIKTFSVYINYITSRLAELEPDGRWHNN